MPSLLQRPQRVDGLGSLEPEYSPGALRDVVAQQPVPLRGRRRVQVRAQEPALDRWRILVACRGGPASDAPRRAEARAARPPGSLEEGHPVHRRHDDLNGVISHDRLERSQPVVRPHAADSLAGDPP